MSSGQPQPRGRGAGIGASESATIGCQHSTLDQRTEHAFAPCGLEAEETRGLGERQPHSWHFAELRRYTRLKCGQIGLIRSRLGQLGSANVLERWTHRPLLKSVGVED
jgi:hypothetical protein